jgi:serine protease Do
MTRESEAYDAGIRPGDVIVAFNGQAITDPSQFMRMISDSKIGSSITLKVLRDGRAMDFKLAIVSSSTARPRR